MNKEYLIRAEKRSDYADVENVVREAFWNVYCPGCSEHYLVHVMRGSEAYVPELALVAVADGRVVGYAANVKAFIECDNGKCAEVLTLGPIAVLPEYQGMGIGAALIAGIKKIAARMGFRAVLLCGNPDFYRKQGFCAAETYGIRSSENLYVDALHACELYYGALAEAAGRYYEDEIYSIDEEAVSEFDRHFPHKEKIEGTPSQQAFLEIVKRCRPAE